MNSHYRIFIWEKITMDDREGTDFSKKRKNHETELSWRNKKLKSHQNWSNTKETHHYKRDRNPVPRNTPSNRSSGTQEVFEKTSVTAIITSMIVIMIMTMVMPNVRTMANLPKKNVSILCADYWRGTWIGTHALCLLVGPHAVCSDYGTYVHQTKQTFHNSWIKIDQLHVTCFIISLFTVNTDGTGSHTYKECHKTESPWNHTSTAHKEREQLGDRRSDGESSCNSGDGTGQMAQPWMFMMMMMMKLQRWRQLLTSPVSRPRWPRGMRFRSEAVRLLWLRVRIRPGDVYIFLFRKFVLYRWRPLRRADL